MSRPDRLFKYLAPERTSVLTDGLIRYTPLGAFNDPFEGRPEITGLATAAHAKATIEALVPKEAKAAYEGLPREARRRISLENWVKLAEANAQAKMPSMLANLHQMTPAMRSWIAAKLDEVVGILSLSASCDNLLMWAHYAASHTGFVVEFDTAHPIFNAKRGEEDEFGHLRRVDYRTVRPSMPMADVEGMDLFLVKSHDWAYEQEWRILQPLHIAIKVIAQKPCPVHLFPVPASAISSVVFGARSTPELRSRLAQAVAQHGYSHIRLREAVPDDSAFRLQIRDAV